MGCIRCAAIRVRSEMNTGHDKARVCDPSHRHLPSGAYGQSPAYTLAIQVNLCQHLSHQTTSPQWDRHRSIDWRCFFGNCWSRLECYTGGRPLDITPRRIRRAWTAARIWRTCVFGLFASAVVLVMPSCSSQGDRGQRPREYRIAVLGEYYISRGAPGNDPTKNVIEWRSGGRGAFLPVNKMEVVRYAVYGQCIVGTTSNGLFILDARPDGNRLISIPVTFGSRGEWEAALSLRAIPADVRLEDPAEIAAKFTEIEIRPWRYRIGGGFLGMPDSDIAKMLAVLTLLVSGVVGLGIRSRRTRTAVSAMVGFVGTAYSGFAFGGADVGMCGLLILGPLLCVCAAGISSRLRRRPQVRRLRAGAPDDGQQGPRGEGGL